MAAPTYQAQGTLGSGTGAVTVLWPSHQADDIALLFVESAGGEAVTLSTPAGFTEISGSPSATGTTTNGTRLTVFWTRTTSSSMTAPVIADAGNHVIGIILTFRGCTTTGNPWDVTGSTVNASAGTTVDFASVTTTVADTLVVLAASRDTDSAVAAYSSFTNSNLTSLTERYDGGATAGNGGGLGIATGVKATAGSTGASTATVTSSINASMTIALKPPNTTPTIALNTADATDFGSDTTPTLEFTGTDTETDDIRYNIQIDSSSTFNSQAGTTIDSYSESNQSADYTIGVTSAQRVGQTFTGDGNPLGSIKLYLKKSGSPTNNIVVEVYAHTGTYGSTGEPTGSILATSDAVASSSLTTSYQLIEFTFSGANQITLTNGTYYCFNIYFTGDVSNNVVMGTDSSSPSHSGNGYRQHLGEWVQISDEVCFYAVTPSTPLLNKVSGTDTGFANTVNGSDSDPFTTGQKVSYTVQAGDALSSGTHYWRVRALDPAGTNTYSSWATSRSFTVSSGTSATVNAGVQTVTSSQPAATVTAIKNATTTPNAQTVTSSQPSASVSTIRNATVTPNAQAIAASQEAPTLSVGDSVSPAPLDVTVSLPTPTVTTTRNVTVSTGAQTVTSTQPSLTITAETSITVSPQAQTVTASQSSPAVTAARNVTVNTNVQSVTGSQPTIGVAVGDEVTPVAQTVSVTQPSPTITTTRNVAVSAGVETITASQPAPVVGVSATVTPDALSGTLSQPTPSVTAIQNPTVSPNTLTVTSTLPAPTVSTSSQVSAGVQTLTADTPSPTIAVGDGATPAPIETSLSLPAPTVSTVRNVTATPLAQVLTASVISPTVSTATHVEVSPSVLSLLAAQNGVGITTNRDVTIQMPVIQLGGGGRGSQLVFIDGRTALHLGSGVYTRL